MKSMTGYGRGEQTQEGYKISVEVSSVNRRQAEINVYLPRELEPLESRVRTEINKRLARGRVTARITLHAGEDVVGQAQVNMGLAKAYARELRKLAAELKISNELTLETLVRAPGVFQADTALADADHFWPAIEAAVQKALEACVKMRAREGAHLAKDLKARIAAMRKSVAKVQKEAPAMVERYREALRERIKNAGLPLPTEEDERLQKEIIYFADRSDITEELTRLESHFKQFDEVCKSEEPVGRTLDFLAQEMNREVNTIGSKASDSTIVREVVTLKTELEKFREQVQNVE
ncbi:MAG TPA: YicC/YloC family endoribonuclease [Verrucomicrobiae bacterium]